MDTLLFTVKHDLSKTETSMRHKKKPKAKDGILTILTEHNWDQKPLSSYLSFLLVRQDIFPHIC
jgi:hypothetical protein